jgi:hypothetical protein
MKHLTISILLIMGVVFICYGQGDTLVPNGKNIADPLHIFIYSLLGCILQEFIYWFELRDELAAGSIPVELNSKIYWIITILSVLFFSLGSYYYFTTIPGQSTANFFTIAVFAAGFPRLFKGAVQQVTLPAATPKSGLVPVAKREFTLRDYFMIHQ